MQKVCQNQWCKAPFEVTNDDLAFYDKVSPVFGGNKYAIPPPTLCPQCRQQRRLTFRNERIYYKRTCDKTGRHVISIYPPKTSFPVYSAEVWWSDEWDGLDYGRSFDEKRSFMTQFEELQSIVPRLYFSSTNCENSEYCNHVADMKNCYLVVGSVFSQDCLFSTRIFHCRNCVDCLWMYHSELCYDCVDCMKCYNVRSGMQCNDVSNSSWVRNCHSSSDLLFCANIRRGKHMILNKQYTPDEFALEKGKILSSPSLIRESLQKFEVLLKKTPVKAEISHLSENCSGNYMTESQNSAHVFDVRKVQDVKYGYDMADIEDSMDVYSFYGPGSLCYEGYSGAMGIYHCLFFRDCLPGQELLYCDHCFGCKDCFGCTGLRQKRYCILNQQYTKEEYETIVPQIIERMRFDTEWGEFFPSSLSPFGYNETTAQEEFPLTKNEVLKRSWHWSDYEPPFPHAEKLIKGKDISSSIDEIPDDIVNWAIECEATKKPFKVIKQELDFYRKMKLSVPRLHPAERHRRRMALRNPRKLYDRTCGKCNKQIETTYAPERPEIVYCEECYLKEVY